MGIDANFGVILVVENSKGLGSRRTRERRWGRSWMATRTRQTSICRYTPDWLIEV